MNVSKLWLILRLFQIPRDPPFEFFMLSKMEILELDPILQTILLF